MMGLSGNHVTLDSGMLSLDDIAIGLSRIPRFAGQTGIHPWSVAHHSLVVERMAQSEIEKCNGLWYYPTGELMLHALFHDAHEAMTGDIPTTFKTSDTRLLQRGLDARLYASLGIAMPTAEQAQRVKTFDHDALVAEARVVCPPWTYKRIAYDAGHEANPNAVEIVRDILQDTEDVALTFKTHAEQLLRAWRMAA